MRVGMSGTPTTWDIRTEKICAFLSGRGRGDDRARNRAWQPLAETRPKAGPPNAAWRGWAVPWTRSSAFRLLQPRWISHLEHTSARPPEVLVSRSSARPDHGVGGAAPPPPVVIDMAENYPA